MRRLLFFLFFLSGFSALVYEVVWARQLTLVFGNTVYAVSTILTIFFAGLALGSLVFGRLADQKSPIFLYGMLELGIGFYAALTPWIFKLIESAQVGLAYRFEPSYSSFSLFTFVLSFFGLIFPTVLMGGTLPVISRFLATEERSSGAVMGNLYGLNTLGGVSGVLLAGFFLIPTLGVRETIWLAAAVNLAIGVVVGSWGIRNKESRIRNQELRTQNSKIWVVFLVFTLTGFAALALEVLWTRVLILVFGSSTYAFTIILAVFLLGIALGSLVASKFLLKERNLVFWLVFFQLLIGLGVVLATPFLDKLPFFFLQNFRGTFESNLWVTFLISFLAILPLTTLMGMIFPIGIRLITSNFTRIAGDLGKLYGFNTFGGILGSLAAGFILIPFLGLQKGIILSGLLYSLSALFILVLGIKPLKLKYIAPVCLIVVFLLSRFFFVSPWDKELLSSGVYMYFQQYLEAEDSFSAMKGGEMIFYKEGLASTVAVMRDDEGLFLRINGKTDASALIDLPTELLVGHLPVLFHQNPKSVLVIGLGSGITLGAVEQHPVERIDMVEIEPAIVEAAKFFEKDNNNALKDDRVKLYLGDGRHFLLTTKNKYDVISSEPSNPWVKGNSDLFSQEYFRLVKEHLKENGVALQWLQYYRMDPESLKAVLATFESVFPYMSVWCPAVSNDLLLIGTNEPLVIDYRLLEKKISDEKVKVDLARITADDAARILGLFLFNQEVVRQITSGVKIHTDNFPVLEFSAPFNLAKPTRGENADIFLQIKGAPFDFVTNIGEKQKEEVEKYIALKDEVLLGKIALVEGNLAKGIHHYNEAWKKDPSRKPLQGKLVRLYLEQARVAYYTKNLPQAKNSLLKAIEIDKSFFKAHLNLGAIYYLEGNIPEAASQWAIAKELDPESEEVEQNLKLLEKYFQGE